VNEGILLLLPLAPILVGDGTGREVRVDPGVVHIALPGTPVLLRRGGSGSAPARLLLAGGMEPSRPAAVDRESAPAAGHACARDRTLHAAVTELLNDLRRPRQDAAPALWWIDVVEAARAAAASERNLVLRTPRVPRGALRLRALLREDPARAMSLEELAEVAALSKYHLLRVFQRAFGLTPHEYQMQLRLARARRLIEQGRPISFAAYDAGFADQSHLTRRFRDYFGLTPAVYARQVTRGSAGDGELLPSTLADVRERAAA
jgi:AraC-like DNA-binding protein